MKTLYFLAILLSVIGSIHAAEKETLYQAQVFRLISTEKETYPAIIQDGKVTSPAITVTYGLFSFRYENPVPLKFWGFDEPQSGKFETRFTRFQVYRKHHWENCSMMYCGTGAKTYPLQTNKDYTLRIALSFNEASDGQQLKASLETSDGRFWSAPFPYFNP